MASIDGVWDTVTQTPFGSQKSTLTLKADGQTLNGTSVSTLGSASLQDGQLDGDRATWKLQLMGMTLTADITFNGDQLSGGISAPGLGTSPIKGQRQGTAATTA